jgi:hypothetical protein
LHHLRNSSLRISNKRKKSKFKHDYFWMSKDKVHTGLRKYDIKDVTAAATGTGLVVHDSTA